MARAKSIQPGVGIRGIGPKRAAELLREYKDLRGVIEAVPTLGAKKWYFLISVLPRRGNKFLAACRHTALMSGHRNLPTMLRVVTLNDKAHLPLRPQDLTRRTPNPRKVSFFLRNMRLAWLEEQKLSGREEGEEMLVPPASVPQSPTTSAEDRLAIEAGLQISRDASH